MTADKKLLVEEGNAGAAFLCAIKGQEVSDAYFSGFENGSDFFEDIKRYSEPTHNIPVSFHEDVGSGSTNVGVQGKEQPEPTTGDAKANVDDTEAGFSNVGKPTKASKKKSDSEE